MMASRRIPPHRLAPLLVALTFMACPVLGAADIDMVPLTTGTPPVRAFIEIKPEYVGLSYSLQVRYDDAEKFAKYHRLAQERLQAHATSQGYQIQLAGIVSESVYASKSYLASSSSGEDTSAGTVVSLLLARVTDEAPRDVARRMEDGLKALSFDGSVSLSVRDSHVGFTQRPGHRDQVATAMKEEAASFARALGAHTVAFGNVGGTLRGVYLRNGMIALYVPYKLDAQ